MTAHPFWSWLFLTCIKSHRRPWYADEVARVMWDDERLAYRRRVVARA
jgi:hypothetical protein